MKVSKPNVIMKRQLHHTIEHNINELTVRDILFKNVREIGRQVYAYMGETLFFLTPISQHLLDLFTNQTIVPLYSYFQIVLDLITF